MQLSGTQTVTETWLTLSVVSQVEPTGQVDPASMAQAGTQTCCPVPSRTQELPIPPH